MRRAWACDVLPGFAFLFVFLVLLKAADKETLILGYKS